MNEFGNFLISMLWQLTEKGFFLGPLNNKKEIAFSTVEISCLLNDPYSDFIT